VCLFEAAGRHRDGTNDRNTRIASQRGLENTRQLAVAKRNVPTRSSERASEREYSFILDERAAYATRRDVLALLLLLARETRDYITERQQTLVNVGAFGLTNLERRV